MIARWWWFILISSFSLYRFSSVVMPLSESWEFPFISAKCATKIFHQQWIIIQIMRKAVEGRFIRRFRYPTDFIACFRQLVRYQMSHVVGDNTRTIQITKWCVKFYILVGSKMMYAAKCIFNLRYYNWELFRSYNAHFCLAKFYYYK